MHKVIAIAAVLLLAGCANPVVKAVASGDVTDALIERIAGVNDRLLEDIDALQAEIARKQARLDKAKCLFPFPALERYARRSEAHRQAVERDCGVTFKVRAVVEAPN